MLGKCWIWSCFYSRDLKGLYLLSMVENKFVFIFCVAIRRLMTFVFSSFEYVDYAQICSHLWSVSEGRRRIKTADRLLRARNRRKIKHLGSGFEFQKESLHSPGGKRTVQLKVKWYWVSQESVFYIVLGRKS